MLQILQQCSGFIDIDKINPDAWPALIADLSAGEQGIVALAFGEFQLSITAGCFLSRGFKFDPLLLDGLVRVMLCF